MSGKSSDRQSSEERKPLEHRSVVSNFIFKEVGNGREGEDESKILVALFRRSEKVHTYQNKLAPISGSIDQSDASPIAAAIRELHEETSLATPADLGLLLRGHPFPISDSKIGRQWTVYPFSWRLAKPASEQRISIDWEHSSWEWVDPARILSGCMESDCVPRLSESLRRVYVGPNSLGPRTLQVTFNSRATHVLRSTLHDLQTDHTNGAKTLATKAGTAIGKIATECDMLPANPTSSDLRAWFRILRMSSWLLITNGRPSMNSAITTCLLGLLDLIQPMVNSASPPPLSEIRGPLQSALASRSSTGDRIASSFASYLTQMAQAKDHSSPNTPITLNLLTLSSSSTLLHSLTHFLSHPHPPNPDNSPKNKTKNIHLNLSILESRPLFEGVTFAASLPTTSSPNFHVTLAPDSAIALLARHAALVLLGADRFSATGDVCNKTGSYAAAVVARAVAEDEGRAREVKVVVVSESEKIAKPSNSREGEGEGEEEEEDNGPEDVVETWRRMGVSKDVEVKDDDEKEEGRTTVRLNANTHTHTGRDNEGKDIQVQVKNVYFEWMPAKYIDAYVTEKGVMSTSEIREVAMKIAQLEEGMFGDLVEIEE